MTDLTASLRLARQGATLTLGLRAYFYLALSQYLAGAWDDVLVTAEQGFSAAEIHFPPLRTADAAPGGGLRAGFHTWPQGVGFGW